MSSPRLSSQDERTAFFLERKTKCIVLSSSEHPVMHGYIDVDQI